MKRDKLRGALRVAVYCVASGVLGTILASVAALGARGAAAFVIWVCVVVVTSVAAGIAYKPEPLNRRRHLVLVKGKLRA